MKDYSHISKFEDILNSHIDIINKTDEILGILENLIPKYNELIEYYYSNQRKKDLKDDERGKIPDFINRGVLSEDEIYNTMIDRQRVAIKMLETATLMLKA